ncbi:MAG: DNA repair protein RecN [Ignavibacteria bacterium]|nr:DNA repair protein RecN [Ignavibacteria bacterium]
MLKSIQIKDYALIENIFVEFGEGLNIITGETGAGKSIIIDAMSLLLGERATIEVVRKGTEKSIVEGIFDVKKNNKVKEICKLNEIEYSDELIIRREISLKGTNRCFLNDTPVTLNQIKEIGDLLVDLHGQHEHQSLLKAETHIDMLDDVADLTDQLILFSEAYYKLNHLLKDLKNLQEKESLLKEKKDLLEFQIKEIDSVSPEIDEDEKIENDLRILENSEKLLSLTNEIYESIYEDENSIQDRLSEIKSKLNELSHIDITLNEKVNEFESVVAILNDISSYLRGYRDKIDIDPDLLESMRARVSSINMLKKKFGVTLKSVLEHRKKIGDEFDLVENFSSKISEINNLIEIARKECGSLAKSISTERKTVAKKIKKEIEAELKNLGIADSKFEVKIVNEKAEDNYILIDGQKFTYDHKGYDKVEFYISTNLGEDPKPLIKVASGGEVSRIMLALKSILAKSDKLPILIFDEIDIGISGRIAQKVGNALKALASYHQIIAITHLPQIAGVCDHHYSVEKKKIADRIVSSIRKLEFDERVNEVAKLMSGEKITEAAINGAKELIASK